MVNSVKCLLQINKYPTGKLSIIKFFPYSFCDINQCTFQSSSSAPFFRLLSSSSNTKRSEIWKKYPDCMYAIFSIFFIFSSPLSSFHFIYAGCAGKKTFKNVYHLHGVERPMRDQLVKARCTPSYPTHLTAAKGCLFWIFKISLRVVKNHKI